jgi:hypothetical protein
MRGSMRRTTGETGVNEFREAYASRNTNCTDFLELKFIRKSTPICPRKIDRLRAGGRRFDDGTWRGPGQSNDDVNPMKHKALIVFAWSSVLAGFVAGVVIVYALKHIGL